MEQIARVSIVDATVKRLRREIHQGTWPVGSKIPTEAQLVQGLGVSRPSVREAVRSLVQLGLLETRQGDGTYVVASDELALAMRFAMDNSDAADILAVRQVLDVLSAETAAKHRSDEDVDALRAALSGRQHALEMDDVEAFITHDVKFHIGIAKASSNQLLHNLYLSFEGALRNAMAERANPDDSTGAVHTRLFEAIERGDAAGAAQAVRDMLTG